MFVLLTYLDLPRTFLGYLKKMKLNGITKWVFFKIEMFFILHTQVHKFILTSLYNLHIYVFIIQGNNRDFIARHYSIFFLSLRFRTQQLVQDECNLDFFFFFGVNLYGENPNKFNNKNEKKITEIEGITCTIFFILLECSCKFM